MDINTFSIVAYSADEDAWGVAVASKFPAVGAVVPWARAGVGAVATQAHTKMSFGPDGLALMEGGSSADETLKTLLASVDTIDRRQVALVDARGKAAAHTGSDCSSWAGQKTSAGFTVQGNLLAGPEVIEAMATGYLKARGELADRLVAALVAGEDAGGDRRGKQSAAVLVVRENAGYGKDNDRYLDLRVDDAKDPVKDLLALVRMHHLYFQPAKAEDILAIDEGIARELQSMLVKQGYISGQVSGDWDADCQMAFELLIGSENLEMRWTLERNRHSIDRVALDYLRERFC